MKITILVSSSDHPINSWLERWANKNKKEHSINIKRNKESLVGGDILFLISCTELVSFKYRSLFSKALVIHASDLPEGRGWSPHIWDIVEGKECLTISLLEAEDEIDSGPIWKKHQVQINKNALYTEINSIIFEAELILMDYAINNISTISPTDQVIDGATYWPRRKACDSEIDIEKSISEQFDLIRVCDPNRYPAYFYKDQIKFKLYIEQVNE